MSDTRRETIVSQEQYDDGPFYFGASYDAGSLDRVIKCLLKIRGQIPKEHRADARCEIDSVSGYEGSHYAHIKILYERPATEAELRADQAELLARQTHREAQERATYEALKRKFDTALTEEPAGS